MCYVFMCFIPNFEVLPMLCSLSDPNYLQQNYATLCTLALPNLCFASCGRPFLSKYLTTYITFQRSHGIAKT